MQSIIFQKRKLFIVALALSALSLGLILNFITENSNNTASGLSIESAEALTVLADARSELPVRLKIPAIDVESKFEYVGLTPDGSMDAPKEPANAGWFNLGPRPGENGSAVIAGHYGWKNGIPAVFDNLSKLKKGDKIYIEDENGVSISFVVRESRSYDPKADASTVFNSSDGKAHLNLITCEGSWNKLKKSYSKRLVVFADQE